MARLAKDTVEYFPHDTAASGGDTLSALEGQFGNDGYAFWFKLLEKLGRTPGHFVDIKDTKPWQVFLGRCHITELLGVEMVNLLVEMGALDKPLWQNHQIIWSQHLVDNLVDVYRNRRREIPQPPSNSPDNPITTPDNQITTTNNPITTLQSKVKESKVNNKEKYIKRKYGEFQNVLLTDKELEKLNTAFSEAGAKLLIEKLSSGKQAKGYKYKSDYAAILTWQRRETGKARNPREIPKSYTDSPDYPDLE